MFLACFSRMSFWLEVMVFYSIAVILPTVVTCVLSLNDTSGFWNSTAHVELASNWRILVHGYFDEFGIESGVPSRMRRDAPGAWHNDLMAELPSEIQLSMWDQDVSNQPILMQTFQDIDNGTHLNFLLPASSSSNIAYLTKFPAPPHLAYKISIDAANRQYVLTPVGSRRIQVVVYVLLGTMPILTGFASIWIYWYAFCTVNVHRFGKTQNLSLLPITRPPEAQHYHLFPHTSLDVLKHEIPAHYGPLRKRFSQRSDISTGWHRRTSLIVTVDYETNSWDIKISVGELGLMAQPMTNCPEDLNLVWVFECVQEFDYAQDRRAEPMTFKIDRIDHTPPVHYRFVHNMIYVLLDAPVFRAQTVGEPYPRGTDDIDSALYYLTWYVLFIIGKPQFQSS